MKKLFKETDKKILISFIIMITMLSTFAIYKIFAMTNVTPEMDSAGWHTVGDGEWLSLTELDSWYDLFCSQKGTHLPSYGNTEVSAGGQSTHEPYLTQNNIGKQLFRHTLSVPSTTPFTDSHCSCSNAHRASCSLSAGTYHSETYGYYKVTETYTTTPMESYILTEMINNEGNHSSSYVQLAWWTTEAGSFGDTVQDNNLSAEARAFEAYILEVAGVNRADSLSYTNKPTEGLLQDRYSKYIENGIVKFKFPEIEYEPEWDYDVVGENFENITFENVTTSWDNNDGRTNLELYKIGPFSIDYIESHYQVTENGKFISDRDYDEETLIEKNEEMWVEFAGITNAYLETNIGKVERINLGALDSKGNINKKDKGWDFRWIKGERDEDDDYQFPHSGEEFYIVMRYVPDATEIRDFVFDFRYMNAGGEYQKLEGKYSIATWKAKSKNNYETQYCDSANCSGHRVHVSTDYWIQLTSLQTVEDSQLLALGIVGCRWYEKAQLRMNLEPDEGMNKGKLTITKQIVDEDGRNLNIQKNDFFEFRIFVNGEYRWSERVQAGDTVETPWIYWDEGEDPPTYEVVEVHMPNGYEEYEIINATGTLRENGTVRVTAKNKQIEDKSGYLRIDKKAYGDIKDKEFRFRVTIGNKTYDNVRISAATSWTWMSDEFTWSGDNAPKYTVSEYETDGVETVTITPKTGYLVDTSSGNIVTVTAVNRGGGEIPEWEYGRIEIIKKLDGNSVSSDIYKFKVTVEGYGTYYATVTAGSTYRSQQFVWEKGTRAPKYTVEEVDIPEGSDLVNITNAEGSLSAGGTVTVTAINKLKEKTGKLKVTKEAITDDKMQNEAITDTFTIQIRISGTFEMNGESIVNGSRTITQTLSAGGTYETPTIKWWGNNAPRYTVIETDIPEGWVLDGISRSSGSLSENETIEVIVTNSFTTRIIIDLTMEMAGRVWEDEYSDDKPPVLNGICDETEEGIDGVEVYIYKVLYNGQNEVNRYLAAGYEPDGETQIAWPLLTQNGGYWKAPRMSVPALTDEEKEAGYKAKYDIEFVYDGQTYEPTTFLSTSSGDASEYIAASTSKRDQWLKDSMALDYDREEVDNRIGEVAGDQPIDSNGKTQGKVIGTDGTENSIEYTSTDYTYGINNSSRKVSTVVTTDDNGVALSVFKAKARTSVGRLLYPFDDRIHLESYDKYIDELGAVQVYHYTATYNYTLNINLGLVKREVADVSAVKDLYDANVVVNEKLLNYRFNSALAYLAEVTGDEGLAYDILNKQIEIQDAGIEYTLGLYESDFYYRAEIYNPENNSGLTDELKSEQQKMYDALVKFYKSINLVDDENNPLKSTELDIYLTYKIVLYNESPSYGVAINEIEDYFDSSFTLVNTTVNKYIQTANGVTIDGVTQVAKGSSYSVTRQTESGAVSGSETGDVNWTVTQSNIKGSDGTTYNKMSADLRDKNITLASGERIEIDVTFSVNKADYHNESANTTVSNCIMLGAKNNVVEIANYSTYYSKTYHPEKEGKIAGKIDKDSAPANVNVENYNEKEWYEDDADAAPILNIELYTEDREINGFAWEDMQNTKIDNGYGQIVGDGIRDEDEYLIGDLTTDLVEKVRILQIDDSGNPVTESGKYVYKEYDFIWPTDKAFDFLGGTTLENLTGFDSTIATAKVAGDGLEEGQYRFSSIPAGNYVVRFTYGDKDIETAEYSTVAIYNGQDYKTTIYQAGFESITDTDGDGYPDNEWHYLTNTDENAETDLAKELAEAKVSDARDDEARRLEVIAKSREIVNENGTILETADSLEADHTDLYDYYMTADTAKINLEIESTNAIKKLMDENNKDLLGKENLDIKYVDGDIVIGGITIHKVLGETQISGVQKGITDITYIVNDIDIGLEERSSTELTLDKQIETIELSTSDNKTILHAEYFIEYELEYNDETGTSTWEAKVELNKEKSFGTEQLQALNKDEKNGIQNFRYINVDETILQGTTIKIGYLFTVLDTGEVDRVGLLQTIKTIDEIIQQAKTLKEENSEYKKAPRATEFEPETMYGKYLGTVYYKGANTDPTIDGVVKTKARQLIDYVDNDAVFTAALNTGIDSSWRNITVEEIAEDKLLDSTIYTVEEDGETILQITDEDNVRYETENKNNIIISVDSNKDDEEFTNKGFIIELIPHSADGYTDELMDGDYKYMAAMRLTTTRYISQETDADDLNFDNIAEVIKYENTVGRRDKEAVPGNADPKNVEGVFAESLNERDTSATELITLTPPTGINEIDVTRIQLLLASLAALIIVVVGVVIIKKKVLK